ncbi:hypothetical protein [Trichococcus sp.]|uniref:hypothetical protein n=1 Tax=Trichococcus sp. TaxID=1985464 RepID=UPI003C7D4D87
MTPFEEGLINAVEQIGATDWVGNIFNVVGILIASLFSALIAFNVAKIQVEKQSEKDIQKEKLMISIRLRVEKYEDIYKSIYEIEDVLQKIEGEINIIDMGLSYFKLMIENSHLLQEKYTELGSALSILYSKQTIYKELKINKNDLNLIFSSISTPISKIFFSCREIGVPTIDKTQVDVLKGVLQVEREVYKKLRLELLQKLDIVKKQIEEFYEEEVLTNKKSATIKDSEPKAPGSI